MLRTCAYTFQRHGGNNRGQFWAASATAVPTSDTTVPPMKNHRRPKM